MIQPDKLGAGGAVQHFNAALAKGVLHPAAGGGNILLGVRLQLLGIKGQRNPGICRARPAHDLIVRHGVDIRAGSALCRCGRIGAVNKVNAIPGGNQRIHLVRDAGRAAAGGMGAAGHITEHGLHAGAQVSAKDQVGIIIKHSGSAVIVPLVSDDVSVIIIAGFWQRLGGQQIGAARLRGGGIGLPGQLHAVIGAGNIVKGKGSVHTGQQGVASGAVQAGFGVIAAVRHGPVAQVGKALPLHPGVQQVGDIQRYRAAGQQGGIVQRGLNPQVQQAAGFIIIIQGECGEFVVFGVAFIIGGMGVAQQPRNAKGITGSIQLAAAVAAQVIGCHMVPGVRQYLGIMELGQQAGGKISGGIAGGHVVAAVPGGGIQGCCAVQPGGNHPVRAVHLGAVFDLL